MVHIPISVGELLDKVSILQVKKEKISNVFKLEFVYKEYELLYNISLPWLSDLDICNLYNELITINSDLWEVEDQLRIFESQQTFNENFIEYARKVYFINDKRFDIKNKINKLTNSNIQEQKEYINYQ
jgi:hypothetical protein